MKKQMLSLLLVLCLCLSLVPIRAEARTGIQTPEGTGDCDHSSLMEQEMVAQAVRLDESEKDRVELLNNGATDYRKWCQTDTRWGSLPLGSSSCTVGSHGCLITSVTKLIIQAGFKSPDSFDVGTMVRWMNSHSGFVSGTGNMYWGKPSECISGFTNQGHLLNSGTYSSSGYNDKLLNWIKQGYHLVIAVKSEGHWVAVDEAKSLATGTIYIMDSLSSGANADVTLASKYSTFNVVHAYKGGTIPIAFQ